MPSPPSGRRGRGSQLALCAAAVCLTCLRFVRRVHPTRAQIISNKIIFPSFGIAQILSYFIIVVITFAYIYVYLYIYYFIIGTYTNYGQMYARDICVVVFSVVYRYSGCTAGMKRKEKEKRDFVFVPHIKSCMVSSRRPATTVFTKQTGLFKYGPRTI